MMRSDGRPGVCALDHGGRQADHGRPTTIAKVTTDGLLERKDSDIDANEVVERFGKRRPNMDEYEEVQQTESASMPWQTTAVTECYTHLRVIRSSLHQLADICEN